jgi:hypothetical protein
MALQSSGEISISQIKTELGSASNSLRTLSSLAGYTTPDSMSEFYGFSSATELAISEIGFPDAEQCCVEGPNYETVILYSASTSLALNVALFTSNLLTEEFDGTEKWWYSDGVSYLINSTGKIIDVFQC